MWIRRLKNRVAVIIAVIWMAGCAGSYHPTSTPETVNGEKMLLGELVYEDILHYFPKWKAQDRQTRVDEKLVARLKRIDRPVELLCYLGTWCSDSRQGVPPMMKALQAANNPHIQIKLIGVDRDKIDPEFTAPQHNIERVPTFILLQDGQEVARMVEYPQHDTFVEDLLEILASNR